jgi:hypothetical protein
MQLFVVLYLSLSYSLVTCVSELFLYLVEEHYDAEKLIKTKIIAI